MRWWMIWMECEPETRSVVGACVSNCVLYRRNSMKVKLVAAVRKWSVILNSAGGSSACCVVRENGGHTFCLRTRDFCLGLIIVDGQS